jgi:uncharacterized protein
MSNDRVAAGPAPGAIGEPADGEVLDPGPDPFPDAVADPAAGEVLDPGSDPFPDAVADPAPSPDLIEDTGGGSVPDGVAGDEEDTAGEVPAIDVLDSGPMCQVCFERVEVQLPSTSPVMVLEEQDPPNRELRITIGGAEGIAIGYASRAMVTPKPLTHELFTRVMELFNISLDVVRITAVRGTSFSGEIVVSGPSGSHVIECRPSDAIALALRQRLPVPIMVAPEVLDEAGVPGP